MRRTQEERIDALETAYVSSQALATREFLRKKEQVAQPAPIYPRITACDVRNLFRRQPSLVTGVEVEGLTWVS